MKHRNPAFLFLAALVIFACNLPSAVAPGSNPQEPAAPAPSLATATFTPTVAAGSTVPFASPAGQPLNCRIGPGLNYAVATVLSEGQAVEIVGKSPDGLWWSVKNPILPGNTCFISMAFATTSGDVSGVPFAVVPPTAIVPTSPPGSSSAGVITSVDISVSPDSIHVAGCIGPIQPVNLYGKIQSNGAINISWHFEDEQSGSLSSHSLKFKKADIQDISDSFTPKVTSGKHKIVLVIDGVNLNGMNYVTYYKVTC